MPERVDGDDLILAVRLTPRGPRDVIGAVRSDAAGQQWLAVTVTAPPEDGKANDALCRLIASHFRVPVSSVRLVAGDTSRMKRLRIRGVAERLGQITGRAKTT